MILKKKIPQDFYKLFRTGNREHYIQILLALYDANQKGYTAIGLTVDEASAIIREMFATTGDMEWYQDEEEETDTMDGQYLLVPQAQGGVFELPSAILRKLIRWGWIKCDFDEKYNTDILSFPEYSQLYVELFQKLEEDDTSQERDSILSVYSALYTYHTDPEKNTDFLKNALRMSKNLSQMMSNMQDGMRTYFDELSQRTDFIGIQEVLIEEIHNSDSRKYAILTTTDSFYRYKEAIKELISKILMEAEESAAEYAYQIEREFDVIERKYKKLIEQKSVFARRALARIHYIFQEGNHRQDQLMELIGLLAKQDKNEEVLEKLRDEITFSSRFYVLQDNSFYRMRERDETEFAPLPVTDTEEQNGSTITEFVPQPLYTSAQLDTFRKKHTKDGIFSVSEDAIHSAEDLEKLFFIWQQATEHADTEVAIRLGQEKISPEGFGYTELTLKKGETDA